VTDRANSRAAASGASAEAALDTSVGAALAVAVAGRLLRRAWLNVTGRDSDAALVPWLEAELAAAGLRAGDIGRWTVGVGPGSFSGLRVGISLVHGICRGSGAALRGLPSSVALAAQAVPSPGAGADVAVLHDARRGQLILSRFRFAGDRWRAAADPCVVEPDALAAELAADTVLATPHADAVRARLPAALVPRLVPCDRVLAEELLAPAGWPWPGDRAEQLASCTPIYVRPAVFVAPVAPRDLGTAD
jgi:tRNA threonylcarbamoyladenosine biosynthesis protein TsaB